MVSSQSEKKIVITDELVLKTSQQNIATFTIKWRTPLRYYILFIKSIRGSDPNRYIGDENDRRRRCKIYLQEDY